MLRVGLTGGLASGKSFVGAILAELGCHVLQADQVGHRLLEPGGAAEAATIDAFGPSILDPAGRIHRQALGALVFRDPKKLEKLNRIIHPLVFAEEDRFFRELAEKEPDGIGVVEAAILIEVGNHENFEKIIVTWCPHEVQLERAVGRGLTREDAEARIARQIPLDQKLAYADAVVDTSGSKQHTHERVLKLHEQLLRWASENRGG